MDDVNLVSREALTGLPVIRAFHRERHEQERFGAASAALRDTQLFVNRTMAFMGPVTTTISHVPGVTVMIEWFGAKSINAGNMQIGDMIAFSTYASLIIMAFMMITIVAVLLPRAEVSATRVDEILRTRASVRDPRSPEPVPADATVTFDHVSFRYPGAEDDVLANIAGVLDVAMRPIDDFLTSDLDTTLTVNVKGTMYVTRAAVKQFIAQGYKPRSRPLPPSAV